MATNNIPDEIETLSRKLLKDPSSRLFLPLAEKYRDAGMLEEAEKVLRDGLTYHPDYVSAIFSLGRVLHEKGNIDAAFSKFQEVVKSAPDNLLAHKKLAEIALKKDLIPEALESLRMVLRLDPTDEKTQALLDKYAPPPPEPVKAEAATASSPAGDATELETFEASTPATELPTPPELDQSSWLSSPADAETMQEVAAEPFQDTPAEGISLPGLDDEQGEASVDLSEFTEETGTKPEPVGENPPAAEPFEVEHMTRDFAEDDTYKLPAVEDIELDNDMGIEIPTTLTPVAGQLDPECSWSEAVSLESTVAVEEEKPVPVHEIMEDEEEPVSSGAIAPPAPDENLQQLFAEIAGAPAPEAEAEAAEEAAEELETETVAELYIQQGDYEKARNIYDSLLAKNPDSSNLRQKLEELQFLIHLIDQKDQA